MTSRQAEIEAKREQLAELRRRRGERQSSHDLQAIRDQTLSPSRGSNRRSDIDDLVASLIGSPRTPAIQHHLQERGGTKSDEPDVLFRISPDHGISSATSPGSQWEEKFTTNVITLFDVKPDETYKHDQPTLKPLITYDKQVQTSSDWPSLPSKDAYNDTDDIQELKSGETVNAIEQKLRAEIEAQLRLEYAEKAAEQKLINEDELKRDAEDSGRQSPVFSKFQEKTHKIIERLLEKDYDLLKDYTAEEEDSSELQSEREIKQVSQFYSKRWSANRPVTSIDWSPKFPELVLASFGRNVNSTRDPPGIVQVFNMNIKSRPEFVFRAQSDILTAKFIPFKQHLIVGGCYSGQMLLWDTRAGPDAVLHSPASGVGHTHPVYSLDVVGSQNANSTISASTDGRVCGWSSDVFAQPQEMYDLKLPPPARSEDISPLALGFPQSDPSFFLLGTEEGTIYQSNRAGRTGGKSGLDMSTVYSGHLAPVTGLTMHPAFGPFDLSDLVLSSSLDWTIRLWKIRRPDQAADSPMSLASTGSLTMKSAKPVTSLLEIPGEEAIYDVSWSPTRPAIFASVDGNGKVSVWDLSKETDVPIAHATPSSTDGVPSALNKISWEKTEGKRLAVGGLSSVVTVFEVGSELGGTAEAKTAEWRVMRKLVAQAEKSLEPA